jgi:hypothetical protein
VPGETVWDGLKMAELNMTQLSCWLTLVVDLKGAPDSLEHDVRNVIDATYVFISSGRVLQARKV